ncbi:MAG: hypothetical protein WBV82_00445 [Myxococcaceae bacterium]
MMLDLREDQARELELLLEYHTRELLQQIDHADDRHFKAELRSRYEFIDEIRQRLRTCLHMETATL